MLLISLHMNLKQNVDCLMLQKRREGYLHNFKAHNLYCVYDKWPHNSSISKPSLKYCLLFELTCATGFVI